MNGTHRPETMTKRTTDLDLFSATVVWEKATRGGEQMQPWLVLPLPPVLDLCRALVQKVAHAAKVSDGVFEATAWRRDKRLEYHDVVPSIQPVGIKSPCWVAQADVGPVLAYERRARWSTAMAEIVYVHTV